MSQMTFSGLERLIWSTHYILKVLKSGLFFTDGNQG
jgi:hypothetical protein